MVSVRVEDSDCTGCGLCADSCPRNVFRIEKKPDQSSQDKASKVVDEGACFACMACVAFCPVGCIEVTDPEPEMIL